MYRASCTKYKKGIRLAKRASWNRFVEMEMNNDPWGIVYKLAAGKVTSSPLHHAISTGLESTITLPLSLRAIIDTLIPVDDLASDTPEQTLYRNEAMEMFSNLLYDAELDLETLDTAIRSVKPYKAPGADNIPGLVIILIYPIKKVYIFDIFNDCFKIGYFLASWKIGNIITILKAPDKDPTLPKAYRPITLLPEFGKLLERCITFTKGFCGVYNIRTTIRLCQRSFDT